jgi:hypothetical protein
MSGIKNENENEKVDYPFVIYGHCFLCEKNAGLLIACTPDIPEMIVTKNETQFICAECVESGKHKELDLEEIKEGDPLRQKYGENEETLLSQLEKIRISSERLYKALVQKDMPRADEKYHEDMDTFIIPTREFRKGIIYELNESDRIILYNILACTEYAILDMTNIIEKTWVEDDKE